MTELAVYGLSFRYRGVELEVDAFIWVDFMVEGVREQPE